MTEEEIKKRYNIPPSLLDEYKRRGLCGEVKKVMDDWQFDESDIEKLSMILTLYDVGFSCDEIEIFMKLYAKGDSTKKEHARMLTEKREGTLDEIHFKEEQLSRLDYLRHQMNK